MASSYIPYAASGDNSRNGEPGSIRFITLCRGRSFPRATCRSRAFSEPPSMACARRSLSSATRPRMRSALAWNSAAFRSIVELRIGKSPSPRYRCKGALEAERRQWRVKRAPHDIVRLDSGTSANTRRFLPVDPRGGTNEQDTTDDDRSRGAAYQRQYRRSAGHERSRRRPVACPGRATESAG